MATLMIVEDNFELATLLQAVAADARGHTARTTRGDRAAAKEPDDLQTLEEWERI